jgi:hypothetical protein
MKYNFYKKRIVALLGLASIIGLGRQQMPSRAEIAPVLPAEQNRYFARDISAMTLRFFPAHDAGSNSDQTAVEIQFKVDNNIILSVAGRTR